MPKLQTSIPTNGLGTRAAGWSLGREIDPVIREISPNDVMHNGDNRNEDHYFSVGRSALYCIEATLIAAKKDTVGSILDLPCGHGRVLRMLKAAFPRARLTACDLMGDAVDFCVRAFGADPVYSSEQVRAIPRCGPFDLIWCGSLLTHLDAPHWPEFLGLYESLLAPGGVLVFTTHGHLSARWMRTGQTTYGLSGPSASALLGDFDRSGFGYRNYDGQANYGISVSSPPWVVSQLARFPGLRLVAYTEQGWSDHQDVIGCVQTEG